ncbi:hypothetical protein BH11VER1_BH11VER1_00920 [soil metagenome]
MKEEKDSSVGVWASMSVGLLLFYMLSIGPVAMVYRARSSKPPPWIITVYTPIIKLVEHSKPAERFYVAYFKFLGVT